ncbi:MAG: K(+)-transporting ATPase subunit C [Sphingobacteriales bacterium]|nr:K(+)-transporting ATPase subunit C [Sphingobacteriales bacterium]MBI3717026.1 K(+)-transporting ATPase subunit C [Sphingobacteriales bacterium]
MKEHIFPAIKITFVSLLFFSGIYTLIVLGVVQFSTNKGDGSIIKENGKKYYSNVGQKFTDDKYFWSRPSAVDYNAASAGGSNKGPTNPQYLAQVQARTDTFLVHNPGVKKEDIPSDLVTSSGSGLDPHISVQAANVQIDRIAKIRGIAAANIEQLILSNTEKPLLCFMGTERINVLKLNLALDNLK